MSDWLKTLILLGKILDRSMTFQQGSTVHAISHFLFKHETPKSHSIHSRKTFSHTNSHLIHKCLSILIYFIKINSYCAVGNITDLIFLLNSTKDRTHHKLFKNVVPFKFNWFQFLLWIVLNRRMEIFRIDVDNQSQHHHTTLET